LLEVAGPIFADRGYQATTIREICAGAEANVAAINYHFGDKLGLYTEVLQQSMRAAQLLAVQNTLDENTPPGRDIEGPDSSSTSEHQWERLTGLAFPAPGARVGTANTGASTACRQVNSTDLQAAT
jgi:AcrR family transcriptional regulator